MRLPHFFLYKMGATYNSCATSESNAMRAMLWFKQDLRLDDHPALQAGLKAECLLPVYVLDPQLLQLNCGFR